jgi:chloride channel 2
MGLIIWVSFAIFFAMIAASVGEYVSRDAEGSGIPEIKSILAGVNIYRYLSFKALIGKIMGTWIGLCAGLSIGKLGPFVHISCGVANKLAKLKAFNDIANNHSIRRSMFAAAVGCGVTAVFGTPIGGVLLSIELTSSYYMVANLWKAFFCSIVTVIAFRIFSMIT